MCGIEGNGFCIIKTLNKSLEVSRDSVYKS